MVHSSCVWVSVDGVARALGAVDLARGTAKVFVPHAVARHPLRTSDDEGVFQTVPLSHIERTWRIESRCNYRGVGPFTVHGISHEGESYSVTSEILRSQPGYEVGLEYAGAHHEQAASLPGFESRGPFHPLGAGVGGKVPLADITDYTEYRTELPIPGRSEDVT